MKIQILPQKFLRTGTIMSTSSNFFFCLAIIIIKIFSQVNGQAPTRQDIINLQNQIDQCQLDALFAIDLANNNNILIQQLQALVDQRWNYVLDRLDLAFAELEFLDNSLNQAWNSIGGLSTRVSELEESVEEVEVAVVKLLANNDIWLNNFKIIKNIIKNGFRFKGTVNYGTPVLIGRFAPRAKVPKTAIVVKAPARKTPPPINSSIRPTFSTILQGQTGSQSVVTRRPRPKVPIIQQGQLGSQLVITRRPRPTRPTVNIRPGRN